MNSLPINIVTMTPHAEGEGRRLRAPSCWLNLLRFPGWLRKPSRELQLLLATFQGISSFFHYFISGYASGAIFFFLSSQKLPKLLITEPTVAQLLPINPRAVKLGVIHNQAARPSLTAATARRQGSQNIFSITLHVVSLPWEGTFPKVHS